MGRSFFEMLTEPATAAFARAREEALGLGHPEIGPEHFLLGLLGGSGSGVPGPGAASGPGPSEEPLAVALRAAGVTLDAARAQVRDLRPAAVEPPADIPLSGPTREVIKEVLLTVMRHRSPLIHPAHLFLGITALPEGDAVRVLAGLGVDVEAARAAADAVALEQVARGPRLVPLRGVERERAVREIVVSRLRVGNALSRYGRHEDSCPQEPCTCGFDEALCEARGPLPQLERLEPPPAED